MLNFASPPRSKEEIPFGLQSHSQLIHWYKELKIGAFDFPSGFSKFRFPMKARLARLKFLVFSPN